MKHIFCVLFLLGIFNGLNAQLIFNDESYYTQKFSTDNGLSQSNANAIIKDYKGFLWIGTDEGLNRFDGYEFKTFNNDPNDSTSLKDDKVWVLFEDSQQQLWIGTNIGGLNLYNRENQSFTSYTHNSNKNASISNNTITSIHEDTNGRLWIGTLWGLNLFEPDKQTFKKFYYSPDANSIANNEVQGLAEKNGMLWVATKKGLSTIDLETLEAHTIELPPTEFNTDINSRVECLFIDTKGEIWIGTNGAGLVKFEEASNSYLQYSLKEKTNSNTSEIILTITEESPGELLVGTNGSGMFKFLPDKEKFILVNSKNDPTLINSSIYGIYKDQEELLWLGVYGNGIVQINKKSRGFHHLEYFDKTMADLGKNSILCIVEDFDKNIRFGTDGSGLYKLNTSTHKITSYQNIPRDKSSISGNVIKSLLVDDKGNIYAGTYANGLNYINTKTNHITRFISKRNDSTTLPTDHIWDIFQDSENRIWVGLLGGFCEFHPDKQYFTRYPIDIFNPNSLGSSDITKIYEDKKNQLWVGTLEGGLGRLDKNTNQFKRYQYNENNLVGLSNNEIKDIFEDKKGKLWVATNGGGLNYYDPDLDLFVWHNSNNDLSNEILSVLEDEYNNFWIGSFQGLIKYNLKSNTIKQYTKGAGIQGNEFNYNSKLIASDGTFYFGGLNGLTYFKPDEIKSNLKVPNVALTDFYLFHEKLDATKERDILQGNINLVENIELTHDQNVITFKYAALDYSVPKKNQYAYKLVGFDKDWNYVQNQRMATYTNIPPGEYTFHVISSNNEGYWNEKGKKIAIIISPPWYRETWAYVLFIFGGGLFLYLTINIRTRFLLRQKNILEAKVRLRTQQIERQKKDLVKQNHFISEQNEELKQKNEEIQAQREQLEEKSVLLEQAHEEIKKTNKELKLYNTELEKTVDKRTVELRETIDQLIKTDEELNTFLYRSSHDLRGPIVTLIGLTQLAKMEIEDDQHHFFFEKIRKACYDMLQFLKKLNDSNVLFKSTKVNRKLNWQKIISDIKSELKIVDPENVVEKSLDIQIDQQLYSDEVMIKTIIQNLMENSIIFCRKNDPFVKLKLTYEDNNLVVSVLDNGIGIDPKIHDKIFNMFFRGSGLSKGNGLGLYLVQRASEIINGQIHFQCENGGTTEFIVKIPIDKAEALRTTYRDELRQKYIEVGF